MNLKNFFQVLSDKRDITSPVFHKVFDRNPKYLSDLENLLEDNNMNNELVTKHIELFKQGLVGEAAVYFELKNSMLPFVGFHDVRLEDGDLAAQMDFIIVSYSVIYVIETKRLYGDIEINENGEFIRKIKNKYGKVVNKEGMYSPITQSARHVRILTEILKKNGLIKTLKVKSIVVQANPKSIIDKSKAPKEIQNSIIKVDQLVNFLTKEFKETSKSQNMLDKYLINITNFISKNHKSKALEIDKYKLQINEVASAREEPVALITNKDNSVKDDLYKELKEYRLLQSRKENVKPYFIFNNATLEEIVEKKPVNEQKLLAISGFGKMKVERYGLEIIKIVKCFI